MSQVLDTAEIGVNTITLPGATPPLRLVTTNERPARLSAGWSRVYVAALKPAFDRTMGAVISLLVLPIIVVLAILVRIKLGKGVFFTQTRVGKDGRPFTIYKFRTMLTDRRTPEYDPSFAGNERRVCHKRSDDPRHTPFGQFLRGLSFDELPQFWNVALGHMSLVGPRPELLSVVEEKYEPWQHNRHWVKPGVTGLWQVSARDSSPMYLHTAVDLDYIEQISLRTDLKIMALTVPSMLKRVGF